MQIATATIIIELEVTVEAGVDQHGFDVVSINAFNGYDSAAKTDRMTGAFKPDQLAELVQQHFAADAQTAIDDEIAEDRAGYLDAMADLAHERRMEAF